MNTRIFNPQHFGPTHVVCRNTLADGNTLVVILVNVPRGSVHRENGEGFTWTSYNVPFLGMTLDDHECIGIERKFVEACGTWWKPRDLFYIVATWRPLTKD